MNTDYWLLFVSFFAVVSGIQHIQIVSNDGISRSTANVQSFIKTNSITDVSFITSYVDCDSPNGCKIVSELTESSPASELLQGVNLILEKESNKDLVIYTGFDSLYSSKFCGCKAADFCGIVSDMICIPLPAKDIRENLIGYDQIFRRLLLKWGAKSIVNNGKTKPFVIMIDTSNIKPLDSLDKSDLSTEIRELAFQIINDGNEKPMEESSLNIHVIFIDVNSPESVQSCRSYLNTLKASFISPAPLSPDDVASKLVNAWNELPAGVPSPIYTPSQRQSVYAIEAAYHTGLAKIDSITATWFTRVGSGKVIGKFASRVKQLLSSVLQVYNSRTTASLTIRERTKRADQLKTAIKTSATNLFKQQSEIVRKRVLRQFRQKLLALMKATDDNQPVNSEEQQQALRNALFDYRSSIAELEIDEFGLVCSSDMIGDMSSALQTMATEFPETATAKLQLVRLVEKKALKSPPKPKRKGRITLPGLNIGLSLVGMFRPPGYGNLQGYLSHATSLLGFPLELLFGVTNDGDSADIAGADREHPILRMQPKVTFDVDLS